jgi:hypothetical protein
MNKGARELNQSSVEEVLRPASLLEPQLLKHLVRFKEPLLIETIEISQIMRLQFPSLPGFNQL